MAAGTLSVVPSACTFPADRRTATVVITSDNPDMPRQLDDLDMPDARNIAVGHAAANGVSAPAINGNIIGPYPVNASGEVIENLVDKDGKPLPPTDPRMQPKSYRISVPIIATR